MIDILFTNGMLVFANEIVKADLAVRNGKIVAIGDSLRDNVDYMQIVDASGKLILPGGVDVHSHLKFADNPFSGSRAAACGGTTTIFDFAVQNKGEACMDRIKTHRNYCDGEVCVDYAIHMAMTDLTNLYCNMEDCINNGVTSFKAYMVYDGWDLNDAEIFTMLKCASDMGGLVEVHAENKFLVDAFTKKYEKEAPTAYYSHFLSRPNIVEYEAIARAIMLAKEARTALYVAHLSSAEGVKLIANARSEGMPVFSETCPHYLNFTSEVYKRPDGRNFICSPSIKGEESRNALLDGLKQRKIDIVASDHCAYTKKEKDAYDTFVDIPNGCPGIETRYPYILSLASNGDISYSRAVEICATAPAKIFGCSDRKGSLSVGKDADIVVYDPECNFIIDNSMMHGNNDQTIWSGVQIKGYPEAVYCRGRLIAKNNVFVGEKGYGKYIACNNLFFHSPFVD